MKNKILNHPSYWTESFNGVLYNIITEYRLKHNLVSLTELSLSLDIDKKILKGLIKYGEYDFTISQIAGICLKTGNYPIFTTRKTHEN